MFFQIPKVLLFVCLCVGTVVGDDADDFTPACSDATCDCEDSRGGLRFQLFQQDAAIDDYCVPWDYCDDCLAYHQSRAQGCGCCGPTLRGRFGRAQERIGELIDAVIPPSPLPIPLFEGLVEGSGMTLPPELGTGIVFTELNRKVAVSDVRLALNGGTPTSVNRVSVPTTKFHASSQIARIDAWILPFINVYGLVGYTKSTGNVDVVVSDFPTMFSPDATIHVPVELEGPTAGWGITTGVGGKHWFATLDVNKTWTNFSQVESSLTALVISPRVGVPIDLPFFKGEAHLGAMYQDTAQTVDLLINHPALGNGLQVQVDQYEPRQWNFLVGGMWAIDERLMVMVEGGMGGRDYIITGITLRY